MTPYYQDDWVTIYHGDNMHLCDWAEDSVDLIVTDPPYNVGVQYGESVDDFRDDFFEWMTPRFRAFRAVSRSLLITGQARLPDYAIMEPWKWLLCWHKPAAMGRSPVGFCNWEPVALWGAGGKDSVDYFRAPIIPDPAIDGHPCPKPLLWAKWQIEMFPDAKTVLDPFCGSGTTLRAAKDLNRKAIGIEIEEKYCEIAANRMNQEVLAF